MKSLVCAILAAALFATAAPAQNQPVVKKNKTERGYSLKAIGLRMALWSDKAYAITNLPAFLGNTLLLVRPAAAGRDWPDASDYTVSADCVAYLIVRHDFNGKVEFPEEKAKQLVAAGWAEAAGNFRVNQGRNEDWKWRIFKKDVAAGKLDLKVEGLMLEAMTVFTFARKKAGDQSAAAEKPSATVSPSGAGDDPVIKGKKLSEWIEDLKDNKKQFAALEAIGSAGAKARAAVPTLLDVLKQEGAASYYASQALQKIGPDAVPALVEAAKGNDEVLSAYATSLLRQKFPDAAKKAGLGSIAEELAAMKKLEATMELKGTSWAFIGGGKVGSLITGGGGDGSRHVSISFGEGSAEWKPMSLFFQRAGKGKVAIDTSKEPARIEISMGDKTYKGIYTVTKPKDSVVTMLLLLSPAGGDYPAAMWKSEVSPPRGAKETMLRLVRVK